MKLWEGFEPAADFLNLDATPKNPGSNTHYIRSVWESEENIIIPNKRKKGVDIQYYEQDEHPSLTTDQKDEWMDKH